MFFFLNPAAGLSHYISWWFADPKISFLPVAYCLQTSVLASELWFNAQLSLLFLTWAQNTFPSPGAHRHPQYKQCSKIAGHLLMKCLNSTDVDGGVELRVLCFSCVPVFWSLSHSLGLKKPSQSSKVKGDPWWLGLGVNEGMEWECLGGCAAQMTRNH